MPVDLRPRNTGQQAPYCLHHGTACELGARPLNELTVMVLQAKQDLGLPAPPVDEHQLATGKERRQAEAELAEAIRRQKADNEAHEAALRGDATTTKETQ